MSELHNTLKTLGPIDWSEVPADNPKPFLNHVFESGELICNSVPHPPGGTDFSTSKPATSKPDSASSAKEITNSEARPPPPHPDHADLQSAWGKPMKLAAKDNPLGINVYKMAGKDRNGAWFARRSVHEGISFTKFKRAMQREFAESLAVQGGPGEGNIRGIGGDRRLEKTKVDGVGQLEVYQLSAQFPGPTTPREFITLLSTSETALTEKSCEHVEGNQRLPRHYMVVSKPVSHPEAPERNGYIRGTYESVELIREIPIHPSPNDGEKSASQEHELNPVEWIMVTRSDPGGGIPRFMVERGTPGSIVADAVKFLDWACGKDEIPDADADEDVQNAASARTEHQQPKPQTDGAGQAPTAPSQHTQAQPAQGGIVSHLTNALEAGIDTYAPVSVSNYTHNYLHPDEDSDSDSSDSSDSNFSFASAQEGPPGHPAPKVTAAASTDTLNMSTISTPETASTKDLTGHDKELHKIDLNKEKLDTKISKKLEAENQKLEMAKQKDNADHAKAVEKHDKEVRKLEEKRQKELAKIEAKREKELKKAEKKRQKNLDQATMSQVSRERDDFRSQVDALKRENASLRENHEHLQQENSILVNRLSETGGIDALKEIKRDVVAGHQ